MKKGFTLIELLAIIILLGIISLIAYPIINTQFNEARQKAYEFTVQNIEEMAREYGTTHNLGYNTDDQVLTLNTLREAGLLKSEDLINPKTKTVMGGCVYYHWDDSNKMYKYRYDSNC